MIMTVFLLQVLGSHFEGKDRIWAQCHRRAGGSSSLLVHGAAELVGGGGDPGAHRQNFFTATSALFDMKIVLK